MKRTAYLSVALFLATVFLVACSGDPETTPTPEAPPPTPTIQPTPTLTPFPTFAPTSTPSPSLEPEVDTSSALSTECVPDGTLDSAAAITSCGVLAAQQIESLSFVAKVNLLSLFPVDGAGGADFSMTLNGAMLQTGRLQFQMVLDLAGATSTVDGVFIGNDTFFKDPDSGQWYEGDPPDTEFLTALRLVGFLMAPNDLTASLDGVTDLDDGSRAYVLVSDFAGGIAAPGLPTGSAGSVTRSVDITDYLTREVKVVSHGPDGETQDFITIAYSGYNEAYELNPPDDLLPLAN